MKRLSFSIEIDAPPQTVWDNVRDPERYKAWTAPFGEGSYFEGSWDKGEQIRFLSPAGGGMVAVIAESRAPEFVSIKHIGMLKDGAVDTTSDEVRAWAPAYENYTLIPTANGTRMLVEMDTQPAWEDFMNEKWPQALAVLKSLSEGR